VLCTAAPSTNTTLWTATYVQYEYEPDVYPSYANTFETSSPRKATTDEEEQADTVESDPETDSTTEPQEEDTDHPSNDDPPET